MLKRVGVDIKMFDDSDKVGTDVVRFHSCPQNCKPNPVEGLLEVYENMVETDVGDVSHKGFLG